MRVLEVKEIMDIELDILKYIHDICEKNNITYFIDFGTLLGAVRHKGFIPWDDDMDISLARDQYDKLHEVLLKEDHPRFKMISYKTNKNYPFPYFRVYDKRTFRESHIRYNDVQLGTCVDVFAYDGNISNEKDRNIINMYNKKRKLSSYKYSGIKNKNHGLKNIPRYIATFLYRFTSTSDWNYKIEKLAKKYPLYESEYAVLTTYDAKVKPFIKTEWLYETIDLEFCGYFFKAPKRWHEFLVSSYGENYMEFPPEDERTIPNEIKTYIEE